MVRDYTTRLYEPAAGDARRLAADQWALATTLAAWRARVKEAWPSVRITSVELDATAGDTESARTVTVTVELDGVHPADVRVEALHGTVGPSGEFEHSPVAVQLGRVTADVYRGPVVPTSPGSYGVTARVLPVHDALATPYDMGLATFAQ
jgi:starch phosphorylase